MESIEDYQRNYPHQADTLFASFNHRNCGKSYDKDRIAKKFREVRAKAGIAKEKISHSNFRDSVASIATAASVYEASIDAVLGHTIRGEKSKYVDPETYPQIAEAACQAVYEYYFG